jgi:hypothetical protein
MTSIKPGACNSAIFANAIFPVGRPVVVRIPQSGNFAEKPAVSIRYYRSATATPSQDGSDDCRRTLQPLQASGGFFDRGRGTRPVDLNLFGPFQAARRSIRALLKFCQEPSRRFTKCFEVLSAVFVHDEQHGENDVEKIRIPRGEIRNVVG